MIISVYKKDFTHTLTFLLRRERGVCAPRKKIVCGFTLVETLVAIAILLGAIVGPLTVASISLSEARLAEDKLTATYLAQGGIELVRYHRDSEAIDGDTQHWLTNLSLCNDGCTIHPRNANVAPCPVSGCAPLNVFTSGLIIGVYAYNTSFEASRFTRTIKVVETETGKEARVTSAVEWEHRGRIESVTVSDHIQAWQ